MSIPTPKTPQSRNANKKTNPQTQTPNKKTNTQDKPLIKKRLPTPPSRAEHKKNTSTSSETTSTIISFLIILCIGIGLWVNKWPIIDYLESHGLRDKEQTYVQDPDALFVGKDIKLTWILSKEQNQYYTHSFVHPNYGKIWLRSSNKNLDNYIGQTTIRWKVIDFVEDTYIIEVKDSSLQTATTSRWSEVSWLQYLSQARIILRDMTNEGIVFQTTTDNQNTFTLSNTLTNQTVTIRYFSCDNTTAHNCKQFVTSFEQSVGVDFADSFGNTFYRLADANTWFVSLDDTIGIYLETTDPTLIPLVVKNMQFITNNRVNKKFTNDNIPSICTADNTQIVWPFSVSLTNHDGEAAVFVKTDSSECLIAINPNNSLWWSLISLSPNTDTTQTTIPPQDIEAQKTEENTIDTSETKPNTISNLNPWNIPQIPLKPWKELKFTSKSAWYTLVFPNPTISYSSFSVSEKIAWLSCRLGTKIIWYNEKSNLEANPALIIYACKTWKANLESNMLSIEHNDMLFIVQVNDTAWIDFANNIRIE